MRSFALGGGIRVIQSREELSGYDALPAVETTSTGALAIGVNSDCWPDVPDRLLSGTPLVSVLPPPPPLTVSEPEVVRARPEFR